MTAKKVINIQFVKVSFVYVPRVEYVQYDADSSVDL